MLVFSRAIALLVLAVLAGSASAAVVLMPLSGRGVPAAAGGSADASLYVQVEAVAGSSPSPPAPLRSAAVPGPNPVWPRVLDMALDGFGTLPLQVTVRRFGSDAVLTAYDNTGAVRPGNALPLRSPADAINYIEYIYLSSDRSRWVAVQVVASNATVPTALAAVSGSQYSTLLTAVTAAGLAPALTSPGPYTVFAPTNTALGTTAVTALFTAGQPAAKRMFLTFHVVSGVYLSRDLLNMNGQTLTTLSGKTLRVSVAGLTVSVGGVAVSWADNGATNGVFHGVATPLVPTLDLSIDVHYGTANVLPSGVSSTVTFTAGAISGSTAMAATGPSPVWSGTGGRAVLSAVPLLAKVSISLQPADQMLGSFDVSAQLNQVSMQQLSAGRGSLSLQVVESGRTLDNVISETPEFSTLDALVALSGNAAELQREGPFTVFAPTDDAISRVGIPPISNLNDVVQIHVVPGFYPASLLDTGFTSVVTANGRVLNITRSGSGGQNLTVNGVPIIPHLVDLAATNGIVFGIDGILTSDQTAPVPTTPEPTTAAPTLPPNVVDVVFNALHGVAVPNLDGTVLIIFPGISDVYVQVEVNGTVSKTETIESEDPEWSLTNGRLALGTLPINSTITLSVWDEDAGSDDAFRLYNSPTSTTTLSVRLADVLGKVVYLYLSGDKSSYVAVQLAERGTTLPVAVASRPATFSTIATLLELADLDDVLGVNGPYTAFFPTDAYLSANPPTLPTDKDDLARILKNHVVADRLVARELAQGQTYSSLAGEPLTITVAGGVVAVNGMPVTLTDIAATNGIIHGLGGILVPPPLTTLPPRVFPTADPSGTLGSAVVVRAVYASAVPRMDPGFIFIPGISDVFVRAVLGGVTRRTAAIQDDNPVWTPAQGTMVFADADLDDTLLLSVIDEDGSGAEDIIQIFEAGAPTAALSLKIRDVLNTAQVIYLSLDRQSFAVVEVFLQNTTIGADIIGAQSFFAGLDTALTTAGLSGALDGPGPLTVFAPTTASVPAVANVLLYHVVSGYYPSPTLKTATSLWTLNGAQLPVSVASNGTIFVGDAQVIYSNLAAGNGIVYGLDRVLALPVLPTVPAFAPPASPLGSVTFRAMRGKAIPNLDGAVFGISEVYLRVTRSSGGAPRSTAYISNPNPVWTPAQGSLAYTNLTLDEQLTVEVLDQDSGDDDIITIFSSSGSANSFQAPVSQLINRATTLYLNTAKTAWVVFQLAQDSLTLADAVLAQPGVLSTAAAAVNNASLLPLLQHSAGPWTLLLPVDSPTLTADMLTIERLQNHIISGRFLGPELVDGLQLVPLNGDSQTLFVSVDSQDVASINGSVVTSSVLVGSNGIIHTLDKPLPVPVLAPPPPPPPGFYGTVVFRALKGKNIPDLDPDTGVSDIYLEIGFADGTTANTASVSDVNPVWTIESGTLPFLAISLQEIIGVQALDYDPFEATDAILPIVAADGSSRDYWNTTVGDALNKVTSLYFSADQTSFVAVQLVDAARLIPAAIQQEGFNVFYMLLERAGFVALLNLAEPFTVFALADDQTSGLSGLDMDTLRAALRDYIVPGVAFSFDLTDGQQLTTLSGLTLTVSIPASASTAPVQIGGSPVAAANIAARYGTIHQLAVPLAAAGAGTTAMPNVTTPMPDSVVGQVSKDSSLSNLYGLVGANDLASALTNVTLFAPTNDAVDAADLDSFSSAQIVDILKYHVVAGTVDLAALPNGTSMLKTLQGEMLSVTRTVDASGAMVVTLGAAQAMLVMTMPAATDGQVYVIDGVLLPPSLAPTTTTMPPTTTSSLPSVVTQVGNTPRLSTLLQKVTAAGLASALTNVTVFAPSNMAFDDADLSKYTPDEVRTILLYHVVAGTLRVDDFAFSPQTLQTLAGATITVERTGTATLSVNSVPVDNILDPASDGQVFVITSVLIPPSLATTTPAPSVTVLDQVAATGTLSTLNTNLGNFPAVQAALSGVTLFAPDNEAFGSIDLNGKDVATILKYHAVSGAVDTTTLGTRTLTTLAMQPLVMTVAEDGLITFNNDSARVRMALAPASNGQVYVINNVLVPPSLQPTPSPGTQTVLQQLQDDVDLDSLVSLVGKDQALLAALNNVTVFAPVNGAFANASLDSFTPSQLTIILKYHVVSGVWAPDTLPQGTTVLPTLAGETLSVRVEGDSLWVNGVAVTTAKDTATNGQVYVIPQVLIPPSLVTPTTTMAPPAQSVAQILTQNDQFSTLVRLANSSDLLSLLASVTVFAPTNTAFAAATEALANYTTDEIKTILQFHIVNEPWNPADLGLGASVQLATASGELLTVRKTTAGQLQVGLEQNLVPTATFAATDGFVLQLAGILLPPSLRPAVPTPSPTAAPTASPTEVGAPKSLTRLIATDTRFSTLANFIAKHSAEQFLSNVTVFAPTDDAFSVSGFNMLSTSVQLQVFYYHVIQNVVNTTTLPVGITQLSPIVGTNTFPVEKTQTGTLYAGPSRQATITEANVYATNGLVQVLSAVVFPPGLYTTTQAPPVTTTRAPTSSPTSVPTAAPTFSPGMQVFFIVLSFPDLDYDTSIKPGYGRKSLISGLREAFTEKLSIDQDIVDAMRIDILRGSVLANVTSTSSSAISVIEAASSGSKKLEVIFQGDSILAQTNSTSSGVPTNAPTTMPTMAPTGMPTAGPTVKPAKSSSSKSSNKSIIAAVVVVVVVAIGAGVGYVLYRRKRKFGHFNLGPRMDRESYSGSMAFENPLWGVEDGGNGGESLSDSDL